jgi:NAD(P)-dependent dehydrogenase (short-subunit alcohol dehydrogenase family)
MLLRLSIYNLFLDQHNGILMAHFLVIAASSAIGQATVSLLKEAGHSVFTTARDDSKIKPDATLDATDFDAVDSVFKQAGTMDGVVNCSGSLLLKPAHLTSKEQYQAVIDASLTTAFATVRAAGKHMNKGGSVVLVSSAAAMEGLANHEAIAAAKAGILGLTLAAAASYAPMNLRVNAVAPGLTETSLTAALTSNETSRKFSEAMHALGRLGKPEDVARAIVFLLDPVNSWITGQVLAVDGGLSRVRPKMKA